MCTSWHMIKNSLVLGLLLNNAREDMRHEVWGVWLLGRSVAHQCLGIVMFWCQTYDNLETLVYFFLVSVLWWFNACWGMGPISFWGRETKTCMVYSINHQYSMPGTSVRHTICYRHKELRWFWCLFVFPRRCKINGFFNWWARWILQMNLTALSSMLLAVSSSPHFPTASHSGAGIVFPSHFQSLSPTTVRCTPRFVALRWPQLMMACWHSTHVGTLNWSPPSPNPPEQKTLCKHPQFTIHHRSAAHPLLQQLWWQCPSIATFPYTVSEGPSSSGAWQTCDLVSFS